MRRGKWQRTDPGPGRNSHPGDVARLHTCVPRGEKKKVSLETRVRWEQTGSGARHPRPNFGNQVLGKSTFRSAHQNTCPWEVEPDPRALAGKRAVSGSPRRTNSLADVGELRLLCQLTEPGLRRPPGRKLAARYAALINPPISSPNPRGET